MDRQQNSSHKKAQAQKNSARTVSEFAHAIISRMFENSRNDQINVRVIREGLPEPPDNDWSIASPEERIEAVWTLTELCLAWNKLSPSEPRLQRTVTRLQRAKR